MAILQRREAGLQATALESGLSEVPSRMSGEQGPPSLSLGFPGACQVAGLLYDGCPETDGVENGVLITVHRVVMWVSPGLQWTLWGKREGRKNLAVCT